MDKRRHPREETDQSVNLTSRAGASFPGRILNFSAGGLLVELSEPSAKPPDAVDVFVGADVPIVAARVVRRSGRRVALAFDGVQLGLAARLRPRSAGGFPAAPKEKLERGEGRLLVRLVEAARSFVTGRTSAFLEHAKDRLIDAADSAASNQRQAHYFEAFTVLRRRQQAIHDGLAERIDARGGTVVPAREGPPVGDDAGGELALVDEAEFDVWLIESDIASNAESALHEPLNALQARLGSLLGEVVEARDNPFGPRALAMHCSDVLTQLELDQLVRKFALRSFGEVVLREAAPLYSALNELLEAGGHRYRKPGFQRQAAPGAQAAAKTAQAGDEAAPSAAMAGDEAAEGAPEGPTGDDAHVETAGRVMSWALPGRPGGAVLDLHRLVQQHRRQGPPRRPRDEEDEPAGPPVEPELLQSLLDELQSRAHRSRHVKLEKRMRRALEELSGEQDPAPDFTEAQGQAVYLADELLTSMTEDMLASDQGKLWIRELEIPLLKLLLDDEDLLGEDDHPARRLLDLLGQVQWRADSEVARDRLIVEEVDRIVSELVRGGRLTRERLEEAARAVERLVRRVRQRTQSNTRRVLEASRGQERLQQARLEVERRLASRFGDREVSDVVASLLDSGFRDLLAVEALRSSDGRGAPEHDAFDVVDRLDTRLSREEPARTSEADPAADRQLLDLVRERLEQSGTDPGAQRELLARLEAQLEGQVQADGQRLDFRVTETDGEGDDDGERDPSIEERLWLGQAKLLDVGDWMIFPEEDGRGRPLKLAWINAARNRYVFVDRDGHKALELNQGELAHRIGRGEASVSADGDRPLTDRSWQAIVERLQTELAHQATHDGTSGLLNRREFERRVRMRISESKLAETTHGIVLIDLDQFRLINSAAGHDAGDQVLHETGTLINELVAVEGADVARTGSDEFAILLPRTEGEAVAALAEAVRVAIKAYEIDWKGRRIVTTASVGWVAIDRETEGFSTLFSQLEIACQSARETGDRVCAFVGSDDGLVRKDRALVRVRELEEGLLGDGLLLMGHQIHRLSDDAPEDGLHYEVLARLRTGDGEVIQPAEFVTAAETYGRVHLLDRAVIEKTIGYLASSPIRDRIDCLSVNVSGLTFGRTGFVEHVLRTLERNGVPATMLCLEITESAAMSDLSRCADMVRELKTHGCRFSLDDFGTGLSSFSYLKHLPVDYLKIDGSFVRTVHEDEDDRGLVRSMHEIAHLLGKRTIGEYAESEAIVATLREIGVDYAQGHAFAEPEPLVELLHIPAVST